MARIAVAKAAANAAHKMGFIVVNIVIGARNAIFRRKMNVCVTVK